MKKKASFNETISVGIYHINRQNNTVFQIKKATLCSEEDIVKRVSHFQMKREQMKVIQH